MKNNKVKCTKKIKKRVYTEHLQVVQVDFKIYEQRKRLTMKEVKAKQALPMNQSSELFRMILSTKIKKQVLLLGHIDLGAEKGNKQKIIKKNQNFVINKK